MIWKCERTKMNLRYLVIDVDGTMTDGGIYYDDHRNELKKFCTRDAAGFFAAHFLGIKTVVLTGRECAAGTEGRLCFREYSGQENIFGKIHVGEFNFKRRTRIYRR